MPLFYFVCLQENRGLFLCVCVCVCVCVCWHIPVLSSDLIDNVFFLSFPLARSCDRPPEGHHVCALLPGWQAVCQRIAGQVGQGLGWPLVQVCCRMGHDGKRMGKGCSVCAEQKCTIAVVVLVFWVVV